MHNLLTSSVFAYNQFFFLTNESIIMLKYEKYVKILFF